MAALPSVVDIQSALVVEPGVVMTTWNKAVGWSLVVGAIVVQGGCLSASSKFHGGVLMDHDISQGATRHFRYESCVDGSGQPFETPGMKRGTTIHLVQHNGQPGLFERSVKGTGSVTTNQWQAEDGTHFLSWVRNAAWEHIVPNEADKPLVRLMHNNFQPKEEGGVTKPSAAHDSGKCVLTPVALSS